MITGYNNKGKIDYQFDTFADMAEVIDISVNLVRLGFSKNKMIEAVDCRFFMEDERGVPHNENPDFDLDFGYPKSKLGDSLILTPADKGYDEAVNSLLASLQEIKTYGEEKPILDYSGIKKYLYFEKRNNMMEEKVEENKNASCAENMQAKDGGSYSSTGSSAHYKSALVEYIDDIELQHGTIIAYLVCESQVTKYRGRAGKKEGVPAEKDLVKANWYSACAEYLMEKINVIQWDASLEGAMELGEKYGFGRPYNPPSNHIVKLFLPTFLGMLSISDNTGLSMEDLCSQKSLGDIVDSILSKK